MENRNPTEYISKYGKEAGLVERLREWQERLGKDKQIPWMGLGLVMDIQAAICKIEGRPVVPWDAPGEPYGPDPRQAPLEFDL